MRAPIYRCHLLVHAQVRGDAGGKAHLISRQQSNVHYTHEEGSFNARPDGAVRGFQKFISVVGIPVFRSGCIR
jgi:hypothetical protein